MPVSYKRSITKKKKKREVYPKKGFITPSVPFAERWFIEMTDRELLYFKTIAEVRNITKAAEKLHIAQPSLTQCLQRIEKNLDCALFYRKKQGLELTKAGELYYQTACRTLELWDDFARKMAGLKEQNHRQLTIGASWYNTNLALIPVLSRYRKEYSYVDINLVEKNTDELERMLSRGKLNLILAHQYPKEYPIHEEMQDHQIKKIPLFRERFLIAAHKEFGLNRFSGFCKDGQFETLKLQVISSLPFVRFSENQRIRKISDFILKSGKIEPPAILSTYGFPSALELVNQKVGITFLPENYIKNSIQNYENIQAFQIEDCPCAYWTAVAEYYPSAEQADLLEPLLELLTENGARYA